MSNLWIESTVVSLCFVYLPKKKPQKTKKLYFPNPRRHRKQHNHQRLSFNIKKNPVKKKQTFVSLNKWNNECLLIAEIHAHSIKNKFFGLWLLAFFIAFPLWISILIHTNCCCTFYYSWSFPNIYKQICNCSF